MSEEQTTCIHRVACQRHNESWLQEFHVAYSILASEEYVKGGTKTAKGCKVIQVDGIVVTHGYSDKISNHTQFLDESDVYAN